MTAAQFGELAGAVAARFGENGGISENELIGRWFAVGVLGSLGYGPLSDDLQIEKTVPGAGRADLLLRSAGQRVSVVVEFKRPGTPLAAHVPQLRQYAVALAAETAAITNGRHFWLYTAESPIADQASQPKQIDLGALKAGEAELIHSSLHRREFDLGTVAGIVQVLDHLERHPVAVREVESIGADEFVQRFSLNGDTVFGRLVRALFAACPELVDRSHFASGAYRFWALAYAREIDTVPQSWRVLMPAAPNQEEIRRFMFALESAYAVLARALLAKAMQDAGLREMRLSNAVRNSVELSQTRGRLTPAGQLKVVHEVFDHSGRQAFGRLFASDLFDWWEDGGLLPAPADLANAVLELLLAVLNFDFEGLAGDVLGRLYQSYFDRETRLALGEFYSPSDAVELVLDEVGYRVGATGRLRLLDPACGSGTFLIHALRRFLDEHQENPPRDVLRQLLIGHHIVGLDVNPFAVLLAQVNYAAQILPLFAMAEGASGIESATIPVYRTDSLRIEAREGEAATLHGPGNQRGFNLNYAGDLALIRETLPVANPAGGFVEVELSVPRADLARERGLVGSSEEYTVALTALFDAADASESEQQLRGRLERASFPNPSGLATFMAPALREIQLTNLRLRDEFQDGRFRKTLRDLALATVVKNELRFDAVVGNPPYVRVQRLPELLRRYWRDQYEWSTGNFDLFMPFIERAITGWLGQGGRLGFICSNRFLTNNYAAVMRARLLDVAHPELIVDLRDRPLFTQATNYPAILIVREGASAAGTVECVRVTSKEADSEHGYLADARSALARLREGAIHIEHFASDAFRVSIDELEPAGWRLMPPSERRVFDKLLAVQAPRLIDLTSTESGGFQGIATGADGVLVAEEVGRRNDRIVLRPRGGGDLLEAEEGLTRPWLFGQDVARWRISWARWRVIFPYVEHDGRYRLAPSFEFSDRFPYFGSVPAIDSFEGVWDYLNRPEVKRTLLRRDGGDFQRPGQRHRWYDFARPQNLSAFENAKIVIQVTSTRADCAIDQVGAYWFTAGGTSGVYGVLLKPEFVEQIWSVLGVLNSAVADFLVKHWSQVYQGSSYSYGDQFIRNIPVPLDAAPDVEALAREQTATAQAISELDELLTGFPESMMARRPRTDVFAASRFLDAAPTTAKLRAQDVVWEPTTDGRLVGTGGRTRLSLPGPQGQCLLRWLGLRKGVLPVSEVLAVRLPVASDECRALMAEFDEAVEKRAKLLERATAHDRSLDDACRRAYNLNDEEFEVLMRFLARF